MEIANVFSCFRVISVFFWYKIMFLYDVALYKIAIGRCRSGTVRHSKRDSCELDSHSTVLIIFIFLRDENKAWCFDFHEYSKNLLSMLIICHKN